MRPSMLSHFFLLVITFRSESAIPSIGHKYEGLCSYGYYGYNCRHHCHCQDLNHCDATASCLGECADGWTGSSCQSQNLAFGMPSKIRTRDPDLSSRAAVDGNSSSCVTSTPDAPGWLRVDLQKPTTVYYLTLIVADSTSPRHWQIFVTEYSDFYWDAPCATLRSGMPEVDLSCDSPTTGRYVTVLNTQGPITVCEIQVHACAVYSFGAGCTKTCQCADASEVCHALTGHCTTGCRPGFKGRDCQQPCSMSYGSSCVTPCGQCRKGAACHPVTGMCPGGCEPGWTGDKCDKACEKGRYGLGCAKRCGGCQDNATCAQDTGWCPGLCETGLQGRKCDRVCWRGRYGPSCQFVCGHCVASVSCNVATGVCPRGCAPGWEGLFCTQECLSHNYGENCAHECRQCLTSCDSTTGICDVNGCTVGKRGKKCEQDCIPGTFGKDCNKSCGHCTIDFCDVITGHCPQGLCLPGWLGDNCDKVCPDRSYGANCSEECGSCAGGDICDYVTGVCPNGCEERFFGEKCKTMANFLETTSEASVMLIGTVLAIVLTVVIIVCICLCLKWRRDYAVVKV